MQFKKNSNIRGITTVKKEEERSRQRLTRTDLDECRTDKDMTDREEPGNDSKGKLRYRLCPRGEKHQGWVSFKRSKASPDPKWEQKKNTWDKGAEIRHLWEEPRSRRQWGREMAEKGEPYETQLISYGG